MDALDQLGRRSAYGSPAGRWSCGRCATTDFPEVLAVAHGGIHAPDLMPFSFPWTDATGRGDGPAVPAVPLAREGRARRRSGGSSTSVSGSEGRFVGVQGVEHARLPGHPHRRDRLVARPAVPRAGGSGTLMRQAICVLCLDHLGFEEVTSAAFADNPASQGVSRKVGYRRQRRGAVGPQGRAGDHGAAGAARPRTWCGHRTTWRSRGPRRSSSSFRRGRRRASSARRAPAAVRRAAGLDVAEHGRGATSSSSGASAADHTTSAPPGRRTRRAS